MAVIYQYVAEPGSGLQCVICLEVAEDPWQHGQCGRLLCSECLRRYGEDKPCPNCRRESPQYFEDNKSEYTLFISMYSLMVCRYWLGKRDIHALMIKCSNADCGGIMERHELRRHVRIKCPHTVIPCKYKGIGCDTELKRKDMAAHERNNKFHLHMVMDRVSLESQTLKNGGSMTYSVSEFENLRKNCEEFFSSPFYTHLMTLEVDANGYGRGEGTHVSVFAAILEGEYDAELKWPFV